MAVRKLKPTTPGQRHKIIGVFDNITSTTPEKSLTVGLRKTGGRNNEGHRTSYYRGGGHKRRYRIIDFKRNKLLYYVDGYKAYIIAPNGLEVGATVESGENVAPEVGNALPLSNIPVGTLIHNIEMRPGQGARIARSAGTFAQLTSREGTYAIIKLPSGETRKILAACRATVGVVGNSDHALEQSGKAGRSRWLGRVSMLRD